MVLSDRTIREEIARGRIVIEPFDDSCIQPASIDVHLDGSFVVFRDWVAPHYIDLKQPLDGLANVVDIPRKKDSPFSLQPGQFALGSTIEYVSVPDDLMARLEGKSSLGRVGLLIHATAGYVDPGFKGRLTLELCNVSRLPIILYYGMKISQLSFHRLTTPADRPYGSPGLGSKYQEQADPTFTRYYQEYQNPQLMSLASIPVKETGSAPVRPRGKGAQATGGNFALREWLKTSQFGGNVKALADALGVPLKTVEDWFYRGAKPGPTNRIKVFELTQLAEFKPRDMLLPPASDPQDS